MTADKMCQSASMMQHHCLLSVRFTNITTNTEQLCHVLNSTPTQHQASVTCLQHTHN